MISPQDIPLEGLEMSEAYPDVPLIRKGELYIYGKEAIQQHIANLLNGILEEIEKEQQTITAKGKIVITSTPYNFGLEKATQIIKEQAGIKP